MTPYGIIYADSPYAMRQSVNIWQKKFGTMKISLLIKITLTINLLLAVIYAAACFFLKDTTYIYTYIAQFIATALVVYSVMKTTSVKSLASQCMQKTDLELVLFDKSFTVTTPYSKSEYFYDEIACCCESGGCITIIVDEAVAPFSIQRDSVKTGSYSKVCDILSEILKDKFQRLGR